MIYIAIATETKQLTTETKPRPIHMVACKTIGQYKRNKEKMRKFCLEETRINDARNQHSEQGTSSSSACAHITVKKMAQKTSKCNKSSEHPKGRQIRQLHPHPPQRQRNGVFLQTKRLTVSLGEESKSAPFIQDQIKTRRN